MSSGSPGVNSARPPGNSPIPALVIQDLSGDDNSFVNISHEMSTTLFDVLCNSLLSSRIIPHLPLTSLLALASTNREYRHLITKEPQLSSSFQYLNLSPVKCANIEAGPIDVGGNNWRAERMDEALTLDDFYSGPLRGIFNRLQKNDWLFNVSTLILDGLTVPTEIVREVIMEDRFNVRILSIREVKQINMRVLCGDLKYAVRPSRPEGTSKLRGLYVFGPMDPKPVKEDEMHWARRRSPTRFPETRASETVRAVGARLGEEWNRRSQATLAKELHDADDKWYHSAGKLISRPPHSEWAETIMACEGIIHFDAVLCRGPRHNLPTGPNVDTSNSLPPAVATIALGPKGCTKCGTCPEGPAVFGQSPSYQFPLLAPPPFNTFSIRAAQIPSSGYAEEYPRVIARCKDCMFQRWCERCHKWVVRGLLPAWSHYICRSISILAHHRSDVTG